MLKAIIRRLLERLSALVGASALTLSFFLVLPLIQSITAKEDGEEDIVALDSTVLPPPPPPVEPDDPPEPEPEPEPTPELVEELPLLDLSQIELALNPGTGGGAGPDYAVGLERVMKDASEVQELFSLADLDQEPRCVYQPSPAISAKVRKLGGATVWVIFVVDQRGRVESPKIQRCPNPAFEKPTLAAVSKWRFDPGQHNGKPVRFKMRVPITFPD